MKIINNPTPKIDSINLITGKPVYTDDLVLNNNTLIIKLLRSPHAYAKIKSIDKKNSDACSGSRSNLHF